MKLTLSIKMDNAAFTDDPAVELDCILSGLVKRINTDGVRVDRVWRLNDTCGNNVGEAKISK